MSAIPSPATHTVIENSELKRTMLESRAIVDQFEDPIVSLVVYLSGDDPDYIKSIGIR